MADPAPASTATLERRYRRLLFAYPARYRAERADEIVGTLLDCAPADRRVPRLGEAADLVASGLRRRLALDSIVGLDRGLVVAAPVALALAAGISAFAWWRVEPVGTGVHVGGSPFFGAFRTLGPIAYAAWLLAALARAVLRPAASRALIAVAIAVTVVVVPALAAATPVDRPPLWVLMALAMFGALAFAGMGTAAGAASAASTDERLSVTTGAVAVALSASTVTLVWPPRGGGWGYYYQPTISRVGVVVAVTVAAVAAVAVIRTLRGRPASEWLWATVLLGLPSGWLGPFDTTALRLAGDAAVPHFGRLAQVLLATCVAAVATVWLARRTRTGPPEAAALTGTSTRTHASRTNALSAAGGVALGCAAGIGFFVSLASAGRVGFGTPSDGLPIPPHVLITVGLLVLTGLVAGVNRGGRRSLRTVVLTTGVAAGAAWLVAAYDNGWTVSGWAELRRTTALVATIAVVPLALCAATAAWLLLARPRQPRWDGRAMLVLVTSAGWLGYLTVPYVLGWSPVLLVFAACFVVLAISGRRVRRAE
jgi:hypothetical protein